MARASKIRRLRKIRESYEANKKMVEEKTWRQLKANASRSKKLQREPHMKRTIKRRARRNPKYQGLAQINFESFMKG